MKVLGFRSGKKWKKIVATIGYAFIALILWAGFSSSGSTPTASTPVPAVSAPKPVKTPEQIAQEKADAELKAKQEAEAKAVAEAKAIEDKKAADAQAVKDKYKNWVTGQFSVWDGSHTYLVKLIKENLNDAKSFEHVKTTYLDNGDHLIVKMTYRAKIAFGGTILQNVTAKSDYATNMIKVISQND